jgi:hypothetical protein
MCNHYITPNECEKKNTAWNYCNNNSGFTLKKDSGEIVSVLISPNKPIKLKIYNKINIESIFDYINQSEWIKNIENNFKCIQIRNGLDDNTMDFIIIQSIINPIINKIHYMYSSYRKTNILELHIFNETELVFIAEYFNLNLKIGKISMMQPYNYYIEKEYGTEGWY